jgi:hypothetical protein
MTVPIPDSPTRPITRREAIRRTALLLGAAVTPSLMSCAERARRAAGTEAGGGPRYLTAAEYALVSAISERILPRTDTPGAVDVGVPSFIDLAYGEFMTAEERAMLSEGLASVDAASTSAHGRSFTSLAPARQDEVLRTLARASQDLDRSFFKQIREATVLGYFTSEEVGRNVLHYDPVPGRLDACVPISDVGNVVWTT